ncbi:dienelactone hydrolase family protein [Paracoccus zhejiangensis]|uniref:Hydrolase n=1 Tax=Paracoccus zhejiangensis TaxID=1077935 RepID=A0A2H5EWG7_9RHOB|nr:dienelactone hydrolase family protein [Paracoccus zhejiangensis]AUH63642.1 hydrolase [Paracoccus zhejiangensis]
MTGPRQITEDNRIPALIALAARRGFSHGWREGLDPKEWRERGLALMRDLALPDLPMSAPAWTVEAEEDRGTHLLQSLTLHLAEGWDAPALFLRPKTSAPCPAVLMLHDHGSEFALGKEKCLTPPGPSDPRVAAWADRFFGGQVPGDELARRGFAVLAADAPGWGERPGNGYEAQQALAANLMAIGMSPAGLMAWEDARAVEILAQLPGVESGRIAAVGFSLGGFRSWQVAALSPQVRAAVSMSWMASLPALLVPGNNQTRGQSAFWMTHPVLMRHLDLPDIAALAAPKPLWVEVGRADHLFPDAAVDPAYAKLRSVWTAWGAAEHLSLHRPETGHSFLPDRQAAAFDWLQVALA